MSEPEYKLDDTDGPKHEFLLDSTGGLSKTVRRLPRIREYIESLPETTATFKLSDAGEFAAHTVTEQMIEFLKAWPLADYHAQSNHGGRHFVNPDYIHAHTYTDLIVECECGATFTRNYEADDSRLRDEDNHADHCMPYQRLRCRARMSELRWNEMNRLTRLGWNSSDLAARFGTHQSYAGQLTKTYNTSVSALRDSYRRRAGNTYHYLVHEVGESSKEVADIYGHARDSLNEWYRQSVNVTE